MKNNSIYEDLSIILGRINKVFILVSILMIVVVVLFWKIQVLDYQGYWKKSEANRIRKIFIPYQRGLILDRNGEILATNIGSFRVSIIRENRSDFDESCQKISKLLDLEMDVLNERINKYRSLPLFVPIVIKDNLTLEEVSRIEARKFEMPELVIQAEPKRFYPYGSFASHVIGYLLELSEEDFKNEIYKGRRPGDLIGKTGIEKQYDDRMTGVEGQVLEIVDSLGRNTGEIARREPLKGKDVELTLDFALQKKAEELLEGREGAIVVLNPQNGEILALASYPCFDPNKFINRFTPEEWLELVDDPEFQLENRAIRGMYAPGSVFKLTVALGGLDSHAITERSSYTCSGSVRLFGRPFSCWAEYGHGTVNLYSAIEHSCNVFFYQLGKNMGIEEISRYARKLGFGIKTGIDLPGEKEGLVPDPRWKNKVRGEPWYPGETIAVSVGQGPLLVTPLQVAAHTAIIANRGAGVTPRLLKSNEHAAMGSGGNGETDPKNALGMDASVFGKVVKGMWNAVNENGTAKAARIKEYDVCGKTGSTQTISTAQAERLAQIKKKIKTHSWFSGFAPRDNPKVVVTIIVEYGGSGGETAAPLAKELFESYRKINDR